MKRKTSALVLALALAMSLSVPAFATNQTVTGPVTGGAFDGQGDVRWEASVVADDVISVVMPTSVDFFIKLKPGAYTIGGANTTDKGFDLVLSGEARITNNSSAAIALSCSNVVDGGLASSGTTTMPATVLSLMELALGKVDNNTVLSTADFTAGKLTAGTVNLALGSIPRAIPGATDNVMSLWMHGQKLAAEDNGTWSAVDTALTAGETVTATVTTTLKVALAP